MTTTVEELINDINSEALDLDNLEEISNNLFPLLQKSIEALSSRIVPKITTGDLTLTKQAFELRVKNIIKYALSTYISNRRWETNVKLYPYLLKTISRFGETVLSENSLDDSNKETLNVCPACKEYKMREVLQFDGTHFTCNNCDRRIEDIKKEINNISDKSSISLDYLEKKLYFVKAFSKHSKKGVKCPECNKFVPESCYIGDFLICPYPKCRADCTDALPMKHPKQVLKRHNEELVKQTDSSVYEHTRADIHCSNSNAFNSLDDKEDFDYKFQMIKNIIESQKRTHGNTRKMPVKACVYKAFLNVLENHPKDMVEYITIGGQRTGVSIQSLIYQEFGKCVEDLLPIRFFTKGNEVYIDNVLDERLHIYDGIKRFSNYIDQNNCVRKKIQYSVDRNTFELSLEKEDSFMAKIISIQDQQGNDISDIIDDYSFTLVNLKNNDKIKPGEKITVKYYSIRPNYTLGCMIFVQRIKKAIKESVDRKLKTLHRIKGQTFSFRE